MLTSEGEGGGTIDGSRVSDDAEDRADYRAYVYVGLMVVFGSTTAAAARYIVRELPPGLGAGRPVRGGGAVPPAMVGEASGPGTDLPPRLAAPARRRRDVRPDQPGILPQRRAAGTDLARRPVLCDLPAGRPAPRLDDAAGTPRPGPALGRAGQRLGGLHHRDRQRLARRRAAARDPGDHARRPLAHRRRAVVGRIPRGQQAPGHAARSRCRS